jgi:hypothetical protein
MTPFYAIIEFTELLSEVLIKFTEMLSETSKIILVAKIKYIIHGGIENVK